MFVHAHDHDYVPETIYPEYIPLEDEHEFPAEEQPLPPVDSPTAESPGYVTKSDPEEDPEEYEDDETEDGPVNYLMDRGDDGDDDDGDSSGDDADDEDWDYKDEEEEEGTQLPSEALAVDFVPADTVRSQFQIPSPEQEGETSGHDYPTPSPPIFTITTRLQESALLVTAALPSPPLLPLPPSLYIPPPVDHRDEIPESEQPPRKRLCLSTLGSRYEIGESSTARSTQRIEGRLWVRQHRRSGRLDDRGLSRVHRLAELHEHDAHYLYALLEDAQDSRSHISQRVDMDSQRVDLLIGDRMTFQETVWIVEEEAYASRKAWAHSIGLTADPYKTDHRRQAQMVETLCMMRDMRPEMGDTQTELLALRGQWRARQATLDTRIPDHQDASRDADSHVK
ncbi:hypothetical protein Tco_1483487 [Tanacetum coccineum]